MSLLNIVLLLGDYRFVNWEFLEFLKAFTRGIVRLAECYANDEEPDQKLTIGPW